MEAEAYSNRIRVILELRDYDRLLNLCDPATPPVDLLRPYSAERMAAWPVSACVGNVRNSDFELLGPVI
jgi:putative SOS response-associated peptidase YedK